MPPPVCDRLRDAIVAARPSNHHIGQAWRSSAAVRRLRDAWAGVPDAETAATEASRLLADPIWVAALFAPLIDALAADPLFDPPFKVSRDGLRTSALLYDCPTGSLTATLLSADALRRAQPATTVIVPGRMSVMRVHADGGATLHRWRAETVVGDFALATAGPARALPVLALRDAMVVRIDGRTDAMLIADAARDVVTLTATLRIGAAPVMREYDRRDGRALRGATLDERAARSQMLLTLLRASGRGDSVPAFDAATRDPAFFVRWDAMRQWLASDADAATARLTEMAASDPNDDIRTLAGATLVQLATARVAHA